MKKMVGFSGWYFIAWMLIIVGMGMETIVDILSAITRVHKFYCMCGGITVLAGIFAAFMAQKEYEWFAEFHH